MERHASTGALFGIYSRVELRLPKIQRNYIWLVIRREHLAARMNSFIQENTRT
jgi:hypothetical protein